ncbi:hypothetical protein F3Y22_tig00111084pilonHSYRG00043 [Hibiscus syriacus]|uniref:Uncharacterized protein n=1 Tax=Hibiscus syriacus TaxID=106335 RepID=A0A6A2Z438_HIBSY|nr:uncharacterized protein LOC120152029 [Hibiscus syriacus]KAE8686140.1 hypothetical protein F3Y22_tig00111084pilonHSYRG00043 [Hibiscus syriacus]
MAAKLWITILSLFSIFFAALSNNLTLNLEQITFGHPICRSQIALVNFACAMVPILPMPQSEDGDEGSGSHRHRHRHRHKHKHGVHERPEQRYCCQWLKQIDSLCVCEILVHLPPFLWKLNHKYTVVVDEKCSVTYLCQGRWRL